MPPGPTQSYPKHEITLGWPRVIQISIANNKIQLLCNYHKNPLQKILVTGQVLFGHFGLIWVVPIKTMMQNFRKIQGVDFEIILNGRTNERTSLIYNVFPPMSGDQKVPLLAVGGFDPAEVHGNVKSLQKWVNYKVSGLMSGKFAFIQQITIKQAVCAWSPSVCESQWAWVKINL